MGHVPPEYALGSGASLAPAGGASLHDVMTNLYSGGGGSPLELLELLELELLTCPPPPAPPMSPELLDVESPLELEFPPADVLVTVVSPSPPHP